MLVFFVVGKETYRPVTLADLYDLQGILHRLPVILVVDGGHNGTFTLSQNKKQKMEHIMVNKWTAFI